MAIPRKPTVDPSDGLAYYVSHLIGGLRMHHTKDKGDLGVLKAQADLNQQGYQILIPLTEHAPFDIVIYKDSEFKRVQVKYKSTDRNGKLEIHFRTCWTDKNGTHMRAIDKDSVDLFCIYCPDTDECYYIDPKDFRGSASLRVETPKNTQSKLVKHASDYRRVP